MIKTTKHRDFKLQSEDTNYNYQSNLTAKLDQTAKNFDQATINEIVLWKVNRYAELSERSLALINAIPTTADCLDQEQTRLVLQSLLSESGIQLPLASTILRFRNANIYQIIDQRVYRVLYGKPLKLSTYPSENIRNAQIDLYLRYLADLRIAAVELDIPFEKADRVLYEADKRINKGVRLSNYGG